MSQNSIRLPQKSFLLFAAAFLFSVCALPAVHAEQLPFQKTSAIETAAQLPFPAGPTKLLRYPDIRGNEVVFCYGGDLWKAPLEGGNARRLTAHPGQELFPKFSPDGKWIAFTSQYDGDEQVYVIPADGGEPRQLTWYPTPKPRAPRHGYDCQVMGWMPDSKSVMFRSARLSNSVESLTRLFLIPLDGGLARPLPIPSAGAGDMALDGRYIVFSPLFRDFRSWKRYEGGWAQYLMIYDQTSDTYRPIPTTPRTDRDPMWAGGTAWFVSDRSGALNLYRYDPQKDTVEQKTSYRDWDVRWASSDGVSKIVYEVAGELKYFDTASNQERPIPIHVPTDALDARPTRVDAGNNIEFFELAPGGKRALFVARGDVWTVPLEKGVPRNLTRTSNAHERGAVWSKDGKRIAFISDETGEDQVWLCDQLGENRVQVTDSMTSMLNDLVWSGDSKKLAVRDAKNNLYALLERKGDSGTPAPFEKVLVAHNTSGTEFSAVWSPDGRYLAYNLQNGVDYNTIYIWDSETRQSRQVTDSLFDHFSPAWSPDGGILYFLGTREFYPQISQIEWNFAGNRMTGIFGVTLRPDVQSPVAPESDEAEIADDEKEEGSSSEEADAGDAKTAGKKQSAEDESKKESEKDEKKEIDFDGLAGRVFRLDIESGNYAHLAAAEGFLFWESASAPYYGRSEETPDKVMVYDLAKKKAECYSEETPVFALSPDGKNVIYREGPVFKVGDAAAAPGEAKPVSTELVTEINPRREWVEIFNEVWRRYRDYFYVSNMHGCDWQEVGQRYSSLLPYAAHRSDLNYILSEMVSELNCGHTYIEGGDFAQPKRTPVGLAGALFELDQTANRYRIAKIYKGQNEEPKYRSPLTEPGIDAAVGDYILEIDGVELLGSDNPYRLLRGKSGQVTWKIAKTADGADAREIVYKPIASEANLRYLEFVLDRRDRVLEATGGKVGYIHVPDMGAEGSYEFLKWYYPQRQMDGLIIDDRNNGGGNISQWILMRLNQKVLGTRLGNDRDTPETYPYNACAARMVCLINETSASDGDIFPYYFREAGLGPIIGKRSWGGVVGISDRGTLLDGGTVYVPLSATNAPDGEYIIEGHGVDPDIVVPQDPKAVAQGHDPQLERGIAEVLNRIKADPPVRPTRPADPVKPGR
ncbi:MAG: PD40 domain-containing protein [Thermoguttaceae bacterium]|nr:PD40 domain-containing protein [Thermoguttaceae bacterium]